MDEDEYDYYLREIERLSSEPASRGEKSLIERLYDERGRSVPGCFHVLPAPVEE